MSITTKNMHGQIFIEGEVTKDDLKFIKDTNITATEQYHYARYSKMYQNPRILVELKILAERSFQSIFIYQKEYTKIKSTPLHTCRQRAIEINEQVKANAPEDIEKQIQEHVDYLNDKIKDYNDQVQFRLKSWIQSCDEFDCDKNNPNITKLQEMQKQINQIHEDMKSLKEDVRLQRVEEIKDWFKSDECEIDENTINYILTEEHKMFKDTQIEGVQKKVGFFRR